MADIERLGPLTSTVLDVTGIGHRTIETIRMIGDELHVVFSEHSELVISDRGQNCCEHRYMSCDDDLATFVGDRIVRISTESADNIDGGGEEHEVQFLHVKCASGAAITCQTHNEHNGFYSGFNVKATLHDADGRVCEFAMEGDS